MNSFFLCNSALFKRVILLVICHLFLTLYGCVVVTPNEFDDKTRWMEKNFPDHAKNIDKIQYDPKFKQAILTGQVKVDMSFDEALVAGEITPYGPNPAGKVFWCDNKIVSSCAPECGDCRAMLVRKREIHLFETKQRGLQVVASYPNNKWPAHLTYLPSSYLAARSILRNEYTVGMHFDDIAHVATPPRTSTRYFCGAENRGRDDIPCSQACEICRVEIHMPRRGRQNPRLIELYFHHGIRDHLQERKGG